MTSRPAAIFDHRLLHDPHRRYNALRDQAPVHHVLTPDGAPAWLVTRYDDVRAALGDPRLSVDKRFSGTDGEHGSSLPPELGAHLLNRDPPDHTRLRRLAAAAFTPRRVADLRPAVERIVSTLLDGLAGHDHAELIGSLASPLPLQVMHELLGLPTQTSVDFRTWTNTLLSAEANQPAQSRSAMANMRRFLIEQLAHKGAHPGDDLLTGLLAARDDDDRLTDDELVAMVFLLMFAGYDNSAALIGNVTHALLTNAEVHEAARAGSLALDELIDEVLRWNPSFPLAVRRFAREPITIAGQAIPAGDRIWLCLASANRDPAQFSEPDELGMPGERRPHLSFGHGIHYCLGAPLARLQTTVAVTSLVARFPGIRLAVPAHDIRWRESFRLRGLVALPVLL
ncbi:cytochrome P450 [Micromonospora sp. WMMA1363]|uniref:cytochrome P450 family protein n=1 Tax=Micromonospora sp. WMMA1363 TaxID=3053985 RepID=UPI00259D1383|nr:cytochrome P450 [Micromonospora sp. WMMA1363]MDM4723305.1 cytochrome P450 [Micromonospora sp. WMMA1363]